VPSSTTTFFTAAALAADSLQRHSQQPHNTPVTWMPGDHLLVTKAPPHGWQLVHISCCSGAHLVGPQPHTNWQLERPCDGRIITLPPAPPPPGGAPARPGQISQCRPPPQAQRAPRPKPSLKLLEDRHHQITKSSHSILTKEQLNKPCKGCSCLPV
jgi:hypothetical protein